MLTCTKKRKLNADSNDDQTSSSDFAIPESQIPTRQESYSDFHIIQEVEENGTSSYTEYTSFQNVSHSNRISSTNPLKRRLESELPTLATSIEVNFSHYQQDGQEYSQQRARVGLHTGLSRERQTLDCQSSFQNGGRLSKLKAKELSKKLKDKAVYLFRKKLIFGSPWKDPILLDIQSPNLKIQCQMQTSTLLLRKR